MGRMKELLERKLDEKKYDMYEAIMQIAIPSLKYCEEKYGYDNIARLNLEALIVDIENKGGDALRKESRINSNNNTVNLKKRRTKV